MKNKETGNKEYICGLQWHSKNIEVTKIWRDILKHDVRQSVERENLKAIKINSNPIHDIVSLSII